MTIADDYINSVLDRMPRGTPRRQQIAMELRGHIAERQAHGQAIEDVVRQLGDPATLADSYLAAVPLTSADFLPRVAAKCIDCLMAVTATAFLVGLVFGLVGGFSRLDYFWMLPATLIGGAIAFPLYTVIAEYRHGATIGKRLAGLRVVRESGARISLGQAVVRQIPLFFEIIILDAIFAIFTTYHQRAFELVSKTRTVRARIEEA